MNTITGGIISFAVFTIFFIYGSLKLTHLIDKYNPQISEIEEKSYYDQTDKLSLSDINFKFAVAVEGYIDKELKIDPRYVKFMARIVTVREAKNYETILPFDYCTK